MKLNNIAENMQYVDDFPEPGIRFFDFESIGTNPEWFAKAADELAAIGRRYDVQAIAGYDARGFTLMGVVAYLLGIPMMQIRKKGKLPPPVVSVEYELEYGKGMLEMENNDKLRGKRIMLIDDLLATGGTGEAGARLVRMLGGNPVVFACLTEVMELGGRGKLLDIPVESLIWVRDGHAYANPLIEADSPLKLRLCVDARIKDTVASMIVMAWRCQGKEPTGLAMPGGGIEQNPAAPDQIESVMETVIREIWEELGMKVTPDQVSFAKILVGADRDPRGDQISYVCDVYCDATKTGEGEVGIDRTIYSPSGLLGVRQEAYAFADHYEAMQEFAHKHAEKSAPIRIVTGLRSNNVTAH